MAKINDSKAPAEANADPRDATIRELEESNGSLAARVGELEAEAASRAADIARLLAAAEQRERDNEGARFRVREVESKLVAVEAQRDEFQGQRDDASKRVEALSREVDELHHTLDRGARTSSPDRDLRRTRRALETTALLTMHAAGKGVGVNHERWLSAAMQLADQTAADVEADAAPPAPPPAD
ncbi:MAG: hypothetical protein Q8S73_31520 [Deltaproteobacteria bacterium]|nr:hypothetical protein [Myxococcales bacterium]MDP3218676.1 hypothetical protein [Deltaproteobacteria bacterium]